MCFERCAAQSALYVGLLEGNICGCGNDPAVLSDPGTEAVCDIACSGEADESCGGDAEYDLYDLTACE